jgi:diguanylate cyclase (GGDEF)-like protein/PAS domain S-box-containing protein
VAVFDVDQVPEWTDQPDTVREGIKSALHIGLQGGHQAAILVVTHPAPRHFGAAQVKPAARFAPLASQALLTFDLQRAITQRDRFFQLSLNLMGIVSFNGHFRQFNSAWGCVLGYSEKDLENCSLFDLAHADDRKPLLEAVQQLEHGGEQLLIEHRFLCQDGSYRWLSCSLAAYPDEQLCYIAARDVTDRVLAEQQLAHEAHHDPLTGLYNRAAFMNRLEEAISYAARQPRYHFALLFLDLDRFKIINDTLGHNVGDELLIEVTRRLLGSVRDVDIVSRFGGDEFVILLTDIELASGAEYVAKRIQKQMALPVTIQGNDITPSTSIGITLSSLGYQNAAAVLHDADTAMYIAKSRGKSQYEVFRRK